MSLDERTGCFDLMFFLPSLSCRFYVSLSRGAVLIDFSLTVKADTLIFMSGHGSAISFA